ncbi:hypothetical protein KW791_00450 [Candidatus Parcubacteria bacterium]|nr:hypothetical protein [Candidatus Parcubacteria bacterium]
MAKEVDYQAGDCNEAAVKSSQTTSNYKKATANQSTDYEANLSDKYTKSQDIE